MFVSEGSLQGTHTIYIDNKPYKVLSGLKDNGALTLAPTTAELAEGEHAKEPHIDIWERFAGDGSVAHPLVDDDEVGSITADMTFKGMSYYVIGVHQPGYTKK